MSKWAKLIIPALTCLLAVALWLFSGVACAAPKPAHHGWGWSKVCHHDGCDQQTVT